VLSAAGATVLSEPDGGLSVSGVDVAEIAELALRRQFPVHELTPRSASLEDAYLQLTESSVEYRTASRPSELAAERNQTGSAW
jgi:ABC-2 type transport system ATP-binding protein